MIPLNLPEIEVKLSKEEGKVFIFDTFRKKRVVLTPEEWVRQHFAHYLITELHYPPSLMKIESGLRYNKLAKRSDIVVYNREGLPLILVECKSYRQKLDQKALNQVSIYNQTLKAPYLAVSNGLHHYFFKIDFDRPGFTSLYELPDYTKYSSTLR